MEINFGGPKKEQNKDGSKKGSNDSLSNNKSKKSDEPNITPEDLNSINDINLKSISNIEKQAELYTLKQDERDRNWDEIKLELSENISFLKEELNTLNNKLSSMNTTFMFLLKNFKNSIKQTDLDFVQAKIDSLHFEELTTERDFNNTLKQINND